MTADYTELASALRPEIALLAGSFAVLAADLAFLRRAPLAQRLNTAIALAAIAVVIALALAARTQIVNTTCFGALTLDALTIPARCGVLILILFVLGVTAGGTAPRQPAEYVAIILFAAIGLTLMTAAQQLLVVFLALELASLSLYLLVGFDPTRAESGEAALKYFLFGGVSAAFLLFGFSLLYGLTGAIDLSRISAALAAQGPSPLLAVALVMVLVGFGYKSAAAPFHLWAPDAYQGSPASAAALIASASKLSGLVLLTRILWPGAVAGPGSLGTGWGPILALLCAASLALGNLAALAQINVRRLLAYSAIAHAGALLLGVLAAGASGPTPLLYYAFTYGIATAGAFGVLAAFERAGGGQRLTDLAGLHRRSPLLASCLMIFMLSLAGVPPLAGFFGKVFVFSAALQLAGLAGPTGWLALAAIFFSAIALYYYLSVLKQAWIARPTTAQPRIAVAPVAAITLVTAAAAIIALGIFPASLLELLGH